MPVLEKIISGGQTGADQGALDGAIECCFPYGGTLPAGRKTESGPLPMRYHMHELESVRYRDRTEKNVWDGDGTLILSHGALSGGSELTRRISVRLSKPCLHVDFEKVGMSEAVDMVITWLQQHRISILNVAGPRASSDPDMYTCSRNLIVSLLRRIETAMT